MYQGILTWYQGMEVRPTKVESSEAVARIQAEIKRLVTEAWSTENGSHPADNTATA